LPKGHELTARPAKKKVVPLGRYDRSVGKPGCSRHGKSPQSESCHGAESVASNTCQWSPRRCGIGMPWAQPLL